MYNENPELETNSEITVSPAWKHIKLSRFVSLFFRLFITVCASYSSAVIFISSSSEPLNIYGHLTIGAFSCIFCLTFFLIFDKLKGFLIGTPVLAAVLLGFSFGVCGNVYGLFVTGSKMTAALFCNILKMFSVDIGVPSVETNGASMLCLFVLLSLGTAFIFTVCTWKTTAVTGFFIISASICVPLCIAGAVTAAEIAPLVCAFVGASAMKISEKHGHRENASVSGIVCFILAVSILLPVGASVNTAMKKNDKFFNSLNKIVLFGQSIFTEFEGDVTLPKSDWQRSARLSKRSYKNTSVMRVFSNNSNAVYLRTWAGGAFGNDAWKPVEFSKEVNGAEASKAYERDIILGFEKLFNLALNKSSSDSVLSDIGFIQNTIKVSPLINTSVIAIPITAISSPASKGEYELKINEGQYDGVVLGKFESRNAYSADVLQRISPTDKQNSLMVSLVQSYMRFIDDENYTDSYIKAIKNSNLREEAYAIREEYIKYREFLESAYCSEFDNEAIDRAVTELFETTDIEKYFTKKRAAKDGENTNGQIFIKDSKGNIAKYIFNTENTAYASEIAQTVADYLSDKCSYSLNPKANGKLDAMEDFLFNGNKGYCVQFATAGTLIMRRLGLTARYAEGYIAQRLKQSNVEYTFSSTVYDRHAHAWAEVFVDGIGWVVCEMTPESSDEPDPVDSSEIGSGGITTPPETTVPDTTAPDTSEVDTTESESVSGTEIILPVTTDETAERPPEKQNLNLDAISVFFVIFLAVSVLVIISAYRSKKRKDRLKALIDKALNVSCSRKQRAELERALTEELEKTLRAYKLVPGTAELPSDFADRVNSSLSDKLDKDLPLKAVYAVMSSVYGNGMDENEIKAVALSVDTLNRNGRKNLGIFRYLILKIIGAL